MTFNGRFSWRRSKSWRMMRCSSKITNWKKALPTIPSSWTCSSSMTLTIRPNLLVYSSKTTEQASRVYQKLSEALASLGGIANTMIIGFAVTSIANSLKIKINLMNCIYFFQEFKKQDKCPKKQRNFSVSKDKSPKIVLSKSETHVTYQIH